MAQVFRDGDLRLCFYEVCAGLLCSAVLCEEEQAAKVAGAVKATTAAASTNSPISLRMGEPPWSVAALPYRDFRPRTSRDTVNNRCGPVNG